MIKNIVLALMMLLGSHISYGVQHAITYNLGGSRFGDKVLGYLQARYVSYVTKLPFLYRPFIYSDQLDLSYDALPYDQYAHSYSRHVHVESRDNFTEFMAQIRDESTPDTLYIVDYFPADISEWDRTDYNQTNSLLFVHSWYDLNFSEYMRNSMRPVITIPDFTKENCLNVAMHVRTLSGGDTPQTSWAYLPLKHPSRDYYERQILKVYEWNLKRPMHVFIFSDTDNPHELVAHFSSKFQGLNIEFNIQILTNPDTNNVIQDFFAMQKFDVLIATQSNFSMLAAKIGKFDMVLFPVHVKGQYPNLYIDRVQAVSYASEWFPYEISVVLKD